MHRHDQSGRINSKNRRSEELRVCLERILAIKNMNVIGIRLLGGEEDARRKMQRRRMEWTPLVTRIGTDASRVSQEVSENLEADLTGKTVVWERHRLSIEHSQRSKKTTMQGLRPVGNVGVALLYL